jgi:hypothetical protein
MDNPYWKTSGRTHHLDIESIRRLCFEIISLIEASAPLAQNFEAAELDAERSLDLADYPLLALHLEIAEREVSQLLLQLCLMVRTYDDILVASDAAEAYAAHAKKTDGTNYIGTLSGYGKFDLREACNKVIHTQEIRALYERIGRAYAEPKRKGVLEQDVWYLTGEIELKGTQRGKTWDATLHTQDFIETVLERIAFKAS